MNNRIPRSFPLRAGLRVATGVALMIAALAAPASALMATVPLSDLAGKADQVLRCRVAGMQSHWNAGHTAIVTEVTLDVSEPWKGEAEAGSTLTLTIPGGVVGDVGMVSEHAPIFENGEDTLLFLWRLDGALRVTAEEQGKFTIVDDWIVGSEHRPMKLAEFRAQVARYLRSEGR